MSASPEHTIPLLIRAAAIPGLSIALVRDGTLEWDRGFGVKEAGGCEPVTSSTVFEGASFSKPLVAYGALRLVHEGVLDLDTPLTVYLPDRSFCDDPRLDQITARMVLSHTTGFPNWRRRGKRLTLDRTPGEGFGYSGEGYVYLQTALEYLTGQPLHEHMERTVLSPLGMAQSSYVWRDSYEVDAATGHEADGTPYPKEQPTTASAAVSLHTTPRDFALFLSHVLTMWDRRAENGVDADSILTPQVRVSGHLWWTPGWGLQRTAEDDIVWHWGDNPGFKNFAAVSRRQRRGLVLMTNGDSGLRVWQTIAHEVLGLDHEIFDWLETAFYGPHSLTDGKTE